jgi:hypothetical protein
MYELIDNAPAKWSSAFKAGLAYFVVAFGFGFLLGTFRMLVIVPAVGEISAVMLEMPIMLAISWFSSRWLIGRFILSALAKPQNCAFLHNLDPSRTHN